MDCSCSTYFWLHLCNLNLRNFWPFRIRRREFNEAAMERHCVLSSSTSNIPFTVNQFGYLIRFKLKTIQWVIINTGIDDNYSFI